MLFEGRHEADDCLWGSGPDSSNVGVAGGRVIRLHVEAASRAHDLAAVDRPLEGDTRHTERVYGDHGLWVRPAAMFAETVMVDGRAVPRFTACDAPASGG